MLGFAFVALLLRHEESGLIAAVLLAIGLGLLVVWIGTYISQVHSQVLRLHLKPPRLVYTITMTESGIHVQHARKNEESLDAAWSDIHSIRRCRGDAYIYLSPTQAFILPGGQADAPEAELKKLLQLSQNRSETI